MVEQAPIVTAAREEILSRVRSAIASASAPGVERSYRREGASSPEAWAELFVERVRDYSAEVHRVAPDQVSSAIAAACREHGACRIGIPPGLRDDWRPGELELVEDHRLTPLELDQLDGVLTGCAVAVAETGTIALAANDSAGRRALSLVPDLHVCVVEGGQIVETVPEAIGVLGPLVARERRAITLVSGPSATSDIELSRVEGVHGPRRLVVLVTAEAERRGRDSNPRSA